MNWQTPETPPRNKVVAPVKALKIIVQYRTKQGKLYELQSASGVLAICVGYRGEASDSLDYIIEASTLTPSVGETVEGRGSTPVAALGEVARAWRSRVPALVPFDWDAVARELQAVHAF